ncbi:hypothetical protein M427DRAFT_134612 [Gonapodya prolifera JEL478]|uniref:TLC domain-containing protein n=1 Tax=Gonapodya prolifera (strain JEL478) TaxID=1344416 RepID=A0A139AHH8_GONPJ|nr:hypothetical protein M427DRAFT_134612 [Gonapodya prolifera JEL478]|eukprot:KXS16188.1 hypothetical protein M427DRAFT_134612 [Gonapodya prolifera JEL478]
MARKRPHHPTSLPRFPKYPLPANAPAIARNGSDVSCASHTASPLVPSEPADVTCPVGGSIRLLPSQIHSYSVAEVVTHPSFLKPVAAFIFIQVYIFLRVRKAWIGRKKKVVERRKREMMNAKLDGGKTPATVDEIGAKPEVLDFDPNFDNSFERKTSWILTVLSSLVMTVAGLVGFVGWTFYRWDMARWPIVGASRFSLWIAIYFLTYMWCDIAIGVMYYRSQITLLAGYIHHALFTYIFSFAVYHGLVACILPFCLLELPTLIMAIGQLDKRFRRDYLFGGTYFGTRVALHAALCWSMAVELDVGMTVWPLPAVVLPLHLYWFSRWVEQQKRLRAKRKRQAKEARERVMNESIERIVAQMDRMEN